MNDILSVTMLGHLGLEITLSPYMQVKNNVWQVSACASVPDCEGEELDLGTGHVCLWPPTSWDDVRHVSQVAELDRLDLRRNER